MKQQSSQDQSAELNLPDELNRDLRLTKNILVIHVRRDGREIKELVKGVDIQSYLNDQQELVLARLLERLKSRYSFPLEYCEISYFLHHGEIFMGCGADPINEDLAIDQREYLDQPQLIIRARELSVSLIHKLMSQQVNQKAVNQRQQEEGAETNKCRRTKERRIGYIIDKVVKWRQFYSGIKEEGILKRYSLEEAATKVGISKKSLDDYLLQIRFGRKYGFNFNEHKNDKVGVLRDYVRKNKKTGKPEQKKKRKGKGEVEESLG